MTTRREFLVGTSMAALAVAAGTLTKGPVLPIPVEDNNDDGSTNISPETAEGIVQLGMVIAISDYSLEAMRETMEFAKEHVERKFYNAVAEMPEILMPYDEAKIFVGKPGSDLDDPLNANTLVGIRGKFYTTDSIT